jgi:hypothetical protein
MMLQQPIVGLEPARRRVWQSPSALVTQHLHLRPESNQANRAYQKNLCSAPYAIKLFLTDNDNEGLNAHIDFCPSRNEAQAESMLALAPNV